ncbi:MAG: hypothetical protein SV062_11715 [Thermodesulfobacteriota bacterium]|nr:hypothetical protein [Thermodesulfobacteriota bacterium]
MRRAAGLIIVIIIHWSPGIGIKAITDRRVKKRILKISRVALRGKVARLFLWKLKPF